MTEEGQNMGRHRRSAAGRATQGHATGSTSQSGSAAGRTPRQSSAGGHGAPGIAPYLNPEAYAEVYARSTAYLYATEAIDAIDAIDAAYAPGAAFHATDATAAGPATPGWAPPRSSGHGGAGTAVLPVPPSSGEALVPRQAGGRRASTHRGSRKKAPAPVRSGLLGVSAAVALGAVAVTTGLVPGVDTYRLGGSSPDQVESAPRPGNLETQQGGTSGPAAGDRSGQPPAAPGGSRTPASAGPSASASPSPAGTPTATEPGPSSESAPESAPATPSEESAAPAAPAPGPSGTPTRTPTAPAREVTVSAEAAAEAEVLRLVNVERRSAGCTPLAANSALAALARDFSEDMAGRGFFDHTDPDGASPWDRADLSGVSGLGGENIARGQADAAAVMEAWMNSPGHRANILNCDFKTLGVGVHYADGGPWWTQDFGY